ncbi:hypothetical protein LCGC14_2154400 [marine sediment metagenome]|uniref:Uncharacterized protein n=1 Tax=marine sediment metagenome TaxID=412755 RepID=A0A0F9G7M2_9ZZZZ
MKQTTVFEGIIDTDSGWNYDMPIILIKPAFRFCIGNNDGYIDNIIEDYMIDISLDMPANYPEREHIKVYYKQQCERAKRGRGHMKYWSRTIEWDPCNLEYFKEIDRR